MRWRVICGKCVTKLRAWGRQLIESFARLAPNRLGRAGRQSIDDYRDCLERLVGGWLGEDYPKVRQKMDRLFPEVTRHIPAWCVTNLSAKGGNLPLEPNLFDLLIIDEASQCDIASALPLLYRSTRAVIIGDPHQLRHISNLESARDEELQTAHGLDTEGLAFSFSQNSLFDKVDKRRDIGRAHIASRSLPLAFRKSSISRITSGTAALCEHVRDYDRLRTPPDGKSGVRWTPVSGNATQPPGGSVFIVAEVEAIVEQVIDLLIRQVFDGTVGIVTPFRPQANKIRDRVVRLVSRDVRRRAELIIDTGAWLPGRRARHSPVFSVRIAVSPERFP